MSDSEAPQYNSLPLPLTIGGTRFTTDRVTGPPNKMLPALRDLISGEIRLQNDSVDPVITVEIDTDTARSKGAIRRRAGLSGRDGDDRLYLQYTGRKTSPAVVFRLGRILAFRVLSVEVPTFLP